MPKARASAAAARGDLTLLKRLARQRHLAIVSDRRGLGIIQQAIMGGHVAVLEWLARHPADVSPHCDPARHPDAAVLAARHGHTCVLEWFLRRGFLDPRPGPLFFEEAALGAHFATLDWLAAHFPLCGSAVLAVARVAFARADVALLEWLEPRTPAPFPLRSIPTPAVYRWVLEHNRTALADCLPAASHAHRELVVGRVLPCRTPLSPAERSLRRDFINALVAFAARLPASHLAPCPPFFLRRLRHLRLLSFATFALAERRSRAAPRLPPELLDLVAEAFSF